MLSVTIKESYLKSDRYPTKGVHAPSSVPASYSRLYEVVGEFPVIGSVI